MFPVADASGVGSQIRVEDKIPKNFHPGRVVRKMVVELRSQSLHFGQPRVGDVWEVVVLDVVAHVEEDGVEWTVVAMRGLTFPEQVMFRDKMTCQRVKAQPKPSTQYQVGKGSQPEYIDDEGVERQLNNQVDHFQDSRWFRALAVWTNAVYGRVAEKPQHFGEWVPEEPALDSAGYVHI